eukprot:s763_g15.t1
MTYARYGNLATWQLRFSLLVAALGHDIGHPGVNNGFLSEVGHELAMQYNDRSPLENMHCAKLYTICNKPETNVFYHFTKEQYKEVRKNCIESILHTDMMAHQAMVKDLQILFQMNTEVFTAEPESDNKGQLVISPAEVEIFSEPDTKTKVVNCVLHSGDVSNPCRAWETTYAWALVCLEEFFAQGDQEKLLGIPVQFLNDRDKLNKPNSQIGFIEFMIAPFFVAQIRLWPNLHEMGGNLSRNIASWQDRNWWTVRLGGAESFTGHVGKGSDTGGRRESQSEGSRRKSADQHQRGHSKNSHLRAAKLTKPKVFASFFWPLLDRRSFIIKKLAGAIVKTLGSSEYLENLYCVTHLTNWLQCAPTVCAMTAKPNPNAGDCQRHSPCEWSSETNLCRAFFPVKNEYTKALRRCHRSLDRHFSGMANVVSDFNCTCQQSRALDISYTQTQGQRASEVTDYDPRSLLARQTDSLIDCWPASCGHQGDALGDWIGRYQAWMLFCCE